MASKSGKLPAAAAAGLSADESDDEEEDVVMMADSEDEETVGGATSNMDNDEDDDDEDGDDENSDEDEESDGDKKPAAKSLADGDGSDSDDGDDDGDDDGEDEEDSSSEEEEDSSSEDDEDDEASFVTVTDEFGNERRVSAYEAARIERIRRNKERLASLGLEGSSKDGRRGSTSSGGTLLSAHTAELERKKEERRKKREQRKKELAEMREADRRSSSRKRKKISYAEIKETSISGKKADGAKSSTSNREVSKWRTEKPREKRVPLFIFKELRRIESERKKNLKRSERNNRAADIEYRFAKKNAERVEKAIRRREEMEQQKRQWMERQQEKKELQEFFQAIDDRKQDLVQARSAFDHERFAEMQRRSRNYLDHSRAKMDAIIRFPAAVLDTERHLDVLLLQRCPNDESALAGMPSLTPGTGLKRKRKKKKKTEADDTNDGPVSPMRGAAAAASSGNATPSGQTPAGSSAAAASTTPGSGAETATAPGGALMTTPVTGMLHPSAAPQVHAVQQKTLQRAMARLTANDGSGAGQALPPNASGYPNLTGRTTLPTIAETDNGKSKKTKFLKGKKSDEQGKSKDAGELKDASKVAPDQAKKIRQKIRKRNVGGPVPPEYAKAIQRSWLDNDDVLMPDTKQFVPQAGDLILYYPRGHKEFLETHTDHLGNKTKQITRLPLWKRARKEMADAIKKSEGKSDNSKSPATETKDADEARTSPRKSKGRPSRFRSPGKATAVEAEKASDAKRSASTKKKKKDGASSSPSWWNEEWLAAMESDFGGEYPILCRVENTTAEFPYNKGAVDIATDRKTSWSMKIDRAKKDEIRKQLAKKRPMLRLAVTLKPLTPLVSSSSCTGDDASLDPPLPFFVQCFPSKTVNPFVFPFFWAYRQSHSLSFGDKVRVQFDDDIYTGEHIALADDSCSLDNAFKRFPEIFEEGSNTPIDQRLERLLTVASVEKNAPISFEEIRAVLQFVSHHWHQKQEKKASDSKDKASGDSTIAEAGELRYSTLVDFICATLPRWDNALIRWDASEGEEEENISGVCPWEPSLQDPSKASATYPGSRPGDLVYSLGGKLLENLRLSIQRYVDEHPDSAALISQVDTDATPEYAQNVPLPMSIQRILSRLELRPLKRGASLMSEELTTAHKLPWYRSVAAVVSDLQDIAHNFILYSDLDETPTSDIIKVRQVIDSIKHIAENLDSNAQRKRQKKETTGKAGGQMMLWQSQTMDAPQVKEREPFVAPLRRMWAQEIVADHSWGEAISSRLTRGEAGSSNAAASGSVTAAAAASTKSLDLNSWVPQVGDEVLYSCNEHTKFLRGHFASLSEKQRIMPPIASRQMQQTQNDDALGASAASDGADAESSTQASWIVGTVVSVHAQFPPPPPADDDAAIAARTFDDLTPILEITVYCNYPWLEQKFQIIHWRPCQVRGSDPAHRAPRKKKKAKPAFRPIRVKALVKKKDVYPGRQLYFKPQALKKNPRLARALGIKKQAVRINVQVNGKAVGPPTKKGKSLIIDRKMFMQDEELYLALYGDDATKPARITVKFDGKNVSPKPILLPPSVIDGVDGLSDALDNAGVGEYSSMPIYVKMNDQKVLRKPIMLPPYVIEKVSGLAEAIGSVRREPEPEKSDAEDVDELTSGPKSDPLIGETETGQCKCCGLDSEVSFLRPSWTQPSRYSMITPLPPPSLVAPSGIPSEASSNILRLLEILKQRSIEGIPPDSVRPESFNDGALQSRKRSTSIVSTQAAALRMPEEEREALAKVHYLPPWFVDNGNNEVREGVRRSDAYLPLPYFCLDLVQRRIKQGYYRSFLGATHDIREAYVATVMYLLRSEGVESMKKMAVLLAHRAQLSPPQLEVQAVSETSTQENAQKKKKKKSSDHTFLFGVRVTIKEADLFKRIEQVRKLYGAALTCFSHTIVVETALGKERKEPSIEKISVDEMIDFYRKTEIRKKICHLIDVINPDPCRLRRAIRGGRPNPSVRVKIRVDGQGSNSALGDDQNAAAVAAAASVTELVTTDQQSDIDPSQPLSFEPDDYLSNRQLVRALFGTTGRMEACVRCQKAKRGMFTCRVVRAHSIEDFDLDEVLSGRGIDGLIHDLLTKSNAQPSSAGASLLASDKPTRIIVKVDGKSVFPEPIILPPDAVNNADGAGLAKETDDEEDDDPSTESVEGIQKEGDVCAVADTDGQDDAAASTTGEEESKEHALTEKERAAQAAAAEEEAKEKRTLEAFKKAQLAVQMAKENLLAANAALDVPPALSKQFVRNWFPYDHGDEHYEICVVCGLGGDILCCETCPNVAHTICAGLAKVPEGDWYCRDCVANGKSPSPSEKDDSKESASTMDVGATGATHASNDAADTTDRKIGASTKTDTTKDTGPAEDSQANADDGSNTGEKAKPKDTGESKPDEAGQDASDDAKPSEGSADEPSATDNADSDKKVLFEEDSTADADSSKPTNKDAASASAPPGHWPTEEKQNDEEFEEKVVSLENILHELKSLRYKPKSSSKANEEDCEEKKDENEDEDEDEGAESDAEDDTSSRRSRRRSTKAAKRPRRKRAMIELGTKILKEFEGHGDFEGVIEAVPDSDDEYQEYYRVRYLDGDEEDMSEDEAHACVEYWKEKEAQKEPDDPNVRKRRKPKRFETVQAAAELKGSRKKKDRQKSGASSRSPSRGRLSVFKECAVEGCTKQSQGRGNNHMCRKHFMQTQRGEGPGLSSTPKKKGSSSSLCIVEGCTKYRQTNMNKMCASHFTESQKSGGKRKRGRKNVVYEEVEEAVDIEFAPSPRAKRARRGRQSDYNLDGGPHRRPRGKAPVGKLWDSHHGAWIDE